MSELPEGLQDKHNSSNASSGENLITSILLITAENSNVATVTQDAFLAPVAIVVVPAGSFVAPAATKQTKSVFPAILAGFTWITRRRHCNTGAQHAALTAAAIRVFFAFCGSFAAAYTESQQAGLALFAVFVFFAATFLTGVAGINAEGGDAGLIFIAVFIVFAAVNTLRQTAPAITMQAVRAVGVYHTAVADFRQTVTALTAIAVLAVFVAFAFGAAIARTHTESKQADITFATVFCSLA